MCQPNHAVPKRQKCDSYPHNTIACLYVVIPYCLLHSDNGKDILIQGTKVLKPHDGFGVFNIMGYFKLAISNLKYLPQLYWNYKRKSTKGWSIFNILMDFTGGAGSFLQIAL